jgi:hypothetical protein
MSLAQPNTAIVTGQGALPPPVQADQTLVCGYHLGEGPNRLCQYEYA